LKIESLLIDKILKRIGFKTGNLKKLLFVNMHTRKVKKGRFDEICAKLKGGRAACCQGRKPLARATIKIKFL
jgi:hypothetical protein